MRLALHSTHNGVVRVIRKRTTEERFLARGTHVPFTVGAGWTVASQSRGVGSDRAHWHDRCRDVEARGAEVVEPVDTRGSLLLEPHPRANSVRRRARRSPCEGRPVAERSATLARLLGEPRADAPGWPRGARDRTRTRPDPSATSPRRGCGFESRLRRPAIGARLAAFLLERGYTLLAVLPLVPAPCPWLERGAGPSPQAASRVFAAK